MDVAALRAEIKAWERGFRANHGRDPSVQEIKDQPAIAAKYKLYKSLSKASSATSSSSLSKPAAPPSTPPRSAPRHPPPSSSIVHKSRAIKVDPPVSTSNPFSPVKNRKKVPDQLSPPQRASHQSRPNPFATPSKSKAKPHVTRRSPSPDPFPPIQPLVMVQRTPKAPAADPAVTRARKRLRGEPVSPSPVKQKRPRVASHAALSFAGHAALLDSPDASDGDDAAADPNDTILADTPMKPRTGGRNFKVLFDDVLPNGDQRPVKSLSSRKKTSSSQNVFAGAKRERSRALTPASDEEDDWSLKPRLKSLETLAAGAAPAKLSQSKIRAVNGKHGIPKALVPSKNDLWSEVGPSRASSSALGRTTSSVLPSRTSHKRSSPDDRDDGANANASFSNTFLNLPLIPPSPPPPDASKPFGPKYAEKGKAAAFSRKKAKILQDVGAADEGDEDSPEDEIQVKEIDPAARPPNTDRDVDADSDWEAHWRAPPDLDDPALLVASAVEPGKFEVNLPDELQRILAISPARAKEIEEEKLVRGLLYGRRETHYDPNKGGEIWDVGEDSENAAGTEEEWEGEPVPWEVGEL
ncbi:DNA replication and checkpoint protein-domain-containing protein [Trametes punicea]|nr:DNA replication and checkpoint protein-domain-containing protein [Trametes punicea]